MLGFGSAGLSLRLLQIVEAGYNPAWDCTDTHLGVSQTQAKARNLAVFVLPLA